MSAVEQMEREPMDDFTAVFNNHVNNADKRAREIMKKKCPGWLKRVRDREKSGGGIMAIFKTPKHRAFARYAALVQHFVNESAPASEQQASGRRVIR